MAKRAAGNRPVQQRSIATRAALLDAALECLVDLGYSATTTIETARRAGVSRGAQLHHFPTKAELLTTAVEHLFDRRRAEFGEAFSEVDPDADRFDAAIDLLWSMFRGPVFVAWTELWVAARTDPELAAAVVTMERRFTAETQAMFSEMFPAKPGHDPVFFEIGRDFAFAVMTGVAFQRLFPHGERPATDYLEALKHLFRLARPQADTRRRRQRRVG
jgi:AcrR family transcriptional regulator